ncbi:nucleotidyltransferase [Companilactobacillus allii]|uniref:tRNA(Met) cytidine acetate ligase n=1 Tax=Companilactobacillus allii TaxID=1847728 RepID=A0A1P8Q3X0_9LACO|nr:nucleotidyltransferase [Companilactobacillus allii]APX72545.1 hypothetical protein BTM29_08275 [Companilactobacillus allii]USQ69646.1 nucleotidyltransferase [Companilactobacillus allii]
MAEIYGFVAEFNPFHNGHKIFIDSIKKKYHPDVLIAVVSGNFVQRGDFAIVDKWSRARMAISSGVDLVIELPFAYSVQPADLFAKGSIKLLNELGVNNLVFGTETDLNFKQLATEILKVDTKFVQDYKSSYATNLNDLYKSSGLDILQRPNQLLGLNYVQEIIKNDYNMNVKTILRKADNYSATQIRDHLSNNESISGLVPDITESELDISKSLSWDNYFELLKYQILSSSPQELQQIYQMVEGLEYKFIKEIVNSTDFTDFLMNLKSKRYTLSRLRRLCLYTLLNVKKTEITKVFELPYLRVLGFDDVGKKYLNTLKKNVDVPLITRVGKKESKLLSLEVKVDKIRGIIDDQEQDFGRIPIMEGEI